jgi:hypothetical protein
MGARFTPGPWVAAEQDTWRVEWDGEYRNDGYIIAYRLEGSDAKANAHLIAAAPDLYATLQLVANSLECDREDRANREILRRVNEALAKAEGRS